MKTQNIPRHMPRVSEEEDARNDHIRTIDALLIATSKLDKTERAVAFTMSALRSILNNIGPSPATETECSILILAEKGLAKLEEVTVYTFKNHDGPRY